MLDTGALPYILNDVLLANTQHMFANACWHCLNCLRRLDTGSDCIYQATWISANSGTSLSTTYLLNELVDMCILQNYVSLKAEVTKKRQALSDI